MKREDTRVTALGEHSRGRHVKGKRERDWGRDHKADKMEIQGRAGADSPGEGSVPFIPQGGSVGSSSVRIPCIFLQK